MDQEIRNKLRNVVTQCRKLLEDSVSQELEGKYGIFAKKDQVTADPNAKVTHLTEEEQAARRDILDHFGHIKAHSLKPKQALDQLVREIAFTHLNRLCAYKMMEAREVYVGGQKFREAVSRGINSNGVKFYLADHSEEERLFNTGHQDLAYRHFLDWLGGLLSDEIGVLFNPNDPANRLYPRQKTLDEVLGLLNHGGIKPEEVELREKWPTIWSQSQEETIGWVYQYFTPKELRDQARKESQAPQNSYELAFRNQFFTPRYVVEFLTDNTLGRLWYEMRRGDTKLTDQCRYMVRRSTEIFLKDGEQPPKVAADERDDLSQEELLKFAVHIPHRPKKDPRELKILDPACGSGHFLLYCFDLLLTIYEEAYADPDLGSALKRDYETLEELRRDVPRLILTHNLHGIDIDLRASQIAALALWLRCQRAYQDMGLKKDRPKITKSNVVCAEPMPGETKLLEDFVAELRPRALGDMVQQVFYEMELAGEVGSLLKIEEEISRIVANKKRQYREEIERGTDKFGNVELLTRGEIARLSGERQGALAFSDITDEEFWDDAEKRILDELRRYAQSATNDHGLVRQLFADDAERGFAFVDICRKRFDVVLMNPPFGDPSNPSRCYIERAYARTKNDVYAAFVERGIGLLENSGRFGAITSRTGFFLSSFQRWREEVLLRESQPLLVADLGQGVLDTAMVETAAYCLGSDTMTSTPFVRLLDTKEKDFALAEAIARYREGASHPRMHLADPATFTKIPGSPFSYWLSEACRSLFEQLPTLEGDGREVRVGDHPGDGFRFLRLYWEVPVPSSLDWRNYQKGGDYSPFYYDVHLVADWDAKRQTYRGFRGRPGRLNERPSNYQYFFRPGLTWPRRSQRGLSVRILPTGCVFADKGPVVFGEESHLLGLLSILNSSAFKGLLALQVAFGSYETGAMQRTVIPKIPPCDEAHLADAARTAITIKKAEDSANETTHAFWLPVLLQFTGDTLSERIEGWSERLLEEKKSLTRCHREVDQISFRLYGIKGEDRVRIEEMAGTWSAKRNAVEALTASPNSDEEPEESSGSRTEPETLVSDLLSYCLGVSFGRWDIRCEGQERRDLELSDPFAPLPVCSPRMLQRADGLPATPDNTPHNYPLLINWEGILPDDPDHPDDIVRRIHEVFSVIWSDNTEAIEQETCTILGVKHLRDYFRKSAAAGFLTDHIARYSKSRRKAPIYWLLQSSKKNYALWLYYHRLDKDLIFKALVNYVEPKIRLETSHLETLRSQKATADKSGRATNRLAKEVERQEDFLSELRDFEDKLRRAANLQLVPDLNDGVVLNIAPLHELVPWKEAKNYWDELLKGEYEWSSIGKQLRQKGLVK